MCCHYLTFVRLDIDGKMPLHIAAEAGNVHTIKWYFSLGVHLDQEDVSCLVQLNHQKLVHEVLAQQLERLDTRAYRARCQEDIGNDESGWELGLGILARIEVERIQGRPLSRLGASLLLDAVKYGNMNAVKLLLRQGINPGVCDSNGWSVIHVSDGMDIDVEPDHIAEDRSPFFKSALGVRGRRHREPRRNHATAFGSPTLRHC